MNALLKLAATAWFLLIAQNTYAASPDDLVPQKVPPYLVVDTQTGDIRASHDAYVRWAPASLTKLMTVYTVFRTLELQHLAMNSPVIVSEEAASQPPSKMGFPVGTILTIETALKIIMVKSANDISVALGQAVAGSEATFVNLMNAHARRLGMLDSRFTNPHGLHEPDQFTTARDMAILTLALTNEFPQYANFFDIPAVRVTGRRLRNHNGLLRLYAGTNGMKTGYVCASGYNIAVRTKRGETELAVIVLGGRSGLERNVRAARLLTESFNSKIKFWARTIDTLVKPPDASAIPRDITRTVCPGKYAEAAKPEIRPPGAPTSNQFDAIDTQIVVDDSAAPKEPEIPVPQKRPDVPAKTPTLAKSADATLSETEANVPELQEEDRPPTLRELAKTYFAPRTDLRQDVVLSLNGGIGPNPFGIKHTNGGVYQPPIPVPVKRPDLDLARAEE